MNGFRDNEWDRYDPLSPFGPPGSFPSQERPHSWPENQPDPIPVVEPVFEPMPPVVEEVRFQCWQCGQPLSHEVEQCPWCMATPPPAVIPVKGRSSRSPAKRQFIAVMIGYAAILACLVAVMTYNSLQSEQLVAGFPQLLFPEPELIKKLSDLVLRTTVLGSLATAVMVVSTGLAVGKLKPLPPPSATQQLTTWVVGLFLILPALLIINVAYSLLLRSLAPEWLFDLYRQVHQELAKSLLYFLLMTVHPAIFEEFFFRYLMLGAVYNALRRTERRLAGILSVLVSGLLFAAAHLGQAVAIPYLILVGLALGYLRLASNGILLPILFHFLHNSAVFFLQQL